MFKFFIFGIFFLFGLLFLIIMISIGIFWVILFAILNAPLVFLVIFSYTLAKPNLKPENPQENIILIQKTQEISEN